jgi:hypothetical protein
MESLIDDSDFEPFFAMEDILTQQCPLLETEVAGLQGCRVAQRIAHKPGEDRHVGSDVDGYQSRVTR